VLSRLKPDAICLTPLSGFVVHAPQLQLTRVRCRVRRNLDERRARLSMVWSVRVGRSVEQTPGRVPDWLGWQRWSFRALFRPTATGRPPRPPTYAASESYGLGRELTLPANGARSTLRSIAVIDRSLSARSGSTQFPGTAVVSRRALSSFLDAIRFRRYPRDNSHVPRVNNSSRRERPINLRCLAMELVMGNAGIVARFLKPCAVAA